MSAKGVLLVNLGSPDSPSVPDVRRYLRAFLMDGRVLDAPWPIRFLVVHGLILPFRPKQSAEAYHTIWTPEGSPLVVISRKVQSALQARVSVPVELAMRYQNPSIETAIEVLSRRGVTELHLIPLFPHFAMSSYETAVERVRAVLARRAPHVRLTVEPPYFDREDYVAALVDSARDHLDYEQDHLLFSFHGIPERHLRKSDPTGGHCLQSPDCCRQGGPALATCYRAQCFRTVDAFVRKAAVIRYSVSFQSRLGRDPWLKPYTDLELERLAREGVRRLRVICPAFVSDCLETIEEIGIRGRETFLSAGGTDFALIPCLNEHPSWIHALENMVARFTRSSSALAPNASPS
ncbi:MAG: ferrochelatase [Verrucomicrobia bacterium]|nr:ferrochelatase [Verrucomicrobiota bacterium]